jgi:hypothetical protein
MFTVFARTLRTATRTEERRGTPRAMDDHAARGELPKLRWQAQELPFRARTEERRACRD